MSVIRIRKTLDSVTVQLPELLPLLGKTVEISVQEAVPEVIAEARYVHPSQLYLRFADGLEGTWSFEQLDLDMSNIQLPTVKASSVGTLIEMQSVGGEDVQVDSSSLRYLVDPRYAAEIESKLDNLASRIGL